MDVKPVMNRMPGVQRSPGAAAASAAATESTRLAAPRRGRTASPKASTAMPKLPAAATARQWRKPSHSISTAAVSSVPSMPPTTFARYRKLNPCCWAGAVARMCAIMNGNVAPMPTHHGRMEIARIPAEAARYGRDSMDPHESKTRSPAAKIAGTDKPPIPMPSSAKP